MTYLSRLFAQEPESRKLFERVRGDDVHSTKFQAHVNRVLGGIDMCISLLDNEPVLTSSLKHLAQQHKERGIPASYFDVSD